MASFFAHVCRLVSGFIDRPIVVHTSAARTRTGGRVSSQIGRWWPACANPPPRAVPPKRVLGRPETVPRMLTGTARGKCKNTPQSIHAQARAASQPASPPANPSRAVHDARSSSRPLPPRHRAPSRGQAIPPWEAVPLRRCVLSRGRTERHGANKHNLPSLLHTGLASRKRLRARARVRHVA